MNLAKFEKDLKDHIHGEVHFDLISRKVYSVDASIYEIEPLGVVLPKDLDDLRLAVTIAQSYDVPIIARGAATGITGGCLGKGLIIDTSKYLNHILDINFEKEYVVCEPGVVQDSLNSALALRGYRLGPDTSTGNRATLGGMLANNAAGARSLRYGKMVDHIEEVDLLLSNAEIVHFHACDAHSIIKKVALETTEGHIYRTLLDICKDKKEEIQRVFPKLPRRVSGYNLDELIKEKDFNLCKIIAGSEGTLGIASKMKLKISLCPQVTGLCIIYFEDMLEGMSNVNKMLSHLPLSIEMIDHTILSMARLSPIIQKKIDWLKGDPQAIFIVELEGKSTDEVSKRLAELIYELQMKKIGYAWVSLVDPKEMENVWATRKAGLELLLSKRSYSRAVAFIEDLSIPVERLADFMQIFQNYLKKVGKQAGIYGHVGSGCMHIRPFMDLRKKEETDLLVKMMNDISDLILQFKGAMSGEHGDGLVRTWLNQKMFGDKIVQAFKDVKAAFDPKNLMNPGKITEGQEVLQNLRLSPEVKQNTISTFLNFEPEGGFELSVDMCNGNGLCRKKDNLMCPSFQVTHDEYDTTRARAQSFRAFVNGRMDIRDYPSDGLLDILDLCVECKGCRTECPSQVDMAKIKSEFLYQYQEKNGYSLRNQLFGHIPDIYALLSPFASFANTIQSSSLAHWILDKLQISSQRPFPKLSKQRFSQWYSVYAKIAQTSLKEVILFNDSYTEFICPEVGQAAVRVLMALGYRVIVLPWKCCGRTLLSKGMLKQARMKAKELVEVLFPYAKKGIPILGLEPSCIFTIKEDFSSLLGKDEKMATISRNSMSIDEFLFNYIKDNSSNLPFKNIDKKVQFHGHCHQKAHIGVESSLGVLRAVPGSDVSEIKSGCCGLAGSFGYEKEHDAFSMKIGELTLFPTIRSSMESEIIANGFSCRSQISHGTARSSKHLVEFLADCLKK